MLSSENSAPTSTIATAAKQAHDASQILGTTRGSDRNRGIRAMVEALRTAFDEILEANTLDLETSREMAVPDLVLEWLKLTPERLQTAVEILERVEKISDPIGRILSAPYQLDPSQTYCQLMPLGVVALVYEAFPELGAIAAGFCLKTGNSLILRGGSEASHSNAAIASVLQEALAGAGFPEATLQLLPSEQTSSIRELVEQEPYINLVIPYGRPSLVQQTAQLATVPILRSAMGNCYLYWSASGDGELVAEAIIDSHRSEPDPVNAIEKVLVHRAIEPLALKALFDTLVEAGFDLRGDKEMVKGFGDRLTLAHPKEWYRAYLDKIVAFQRVDNREEAIALIDQNSSGHADCLITKSYEESRQFALGIDSALVYINASPRFHRCAQRSDAVFLGVSNQKGYRRGLIGLESLTTFKQVVQGTGSI